MHKHIKSFYLLIIVFAVFFAATRVFADQPDPYKTICHHTPGNNVTIEFINQQSYEGHLGTPHNDQTYDTEGACETETATPTPTPTSVPDGDKVRICHATDSASNPYTSIEVDADSADGDTGNDQGQGDHSEHTGPVPASEAEAQVLKDAKTDWGDIIPPHHNYGGLNWTAQGQAMWNNDCNYATLTPTPTSTPTPTTAPSGGTGDGSSPSSSSSSGGGEVQGATSPTRAILGLSATSSGNNAFYVLVQFISALLISSVGLRLFKKNA